VLFSADKIQGRLLLLATVFLLLYSVVLTLAPAARVQSWQVNYRFEHWLGMLVWLVGFYILHQITARFLPERDPYILPIAALLAGWGMLGIFRLSTPFGIRQSIWLALSIGILMLGARLPSHLDYLRKYKYIWLTSGILLTASTLFLGTNPIGEGPRLWLGCCGIYIQPSEPLKLLLIIYLAAYLAPVAEQNLTGRQTSSPQLLALLMPTLLMSGLAVAILFAQRDLGTGSIFFFLYAVMVFLASGQKRILLVAIILLASAAFVSYMAFDVVAVRIEAWLNPWSDPSGRSYQIVQSLLAIANGGLPGRGPGMGNPGIVPVAHSDFIFAALVEEGGLIGGIGLVLCYAMFLVHGLRAALRSNNGFHRLLAAGLSAYLTAQAVLIIGGNLRLLPLTGVTLPFVSYGGSSLTTSFISILLLLHISNLEIVSPGQPAKAVLRYMQLAGALLGGLVTITLVTGWWVIYRSSALLQRTDNPRRVIAERYVRRGDLLDRNNQPLAATIGQAGSYSRHVTYAPLSVIIGYNSPTYGLAGLEAGLDGYLRGLQGYPDLHIYWNNLLYGQPPPGLDLRLTLDLSLQQSADQALAGLTGALVMINPKTGEILVMSSSPGFDANQLEQQWQTLVDSPQAPFVNRALQGLYPASRIVRQLFPQLPNPDRLQFQPQLGFPELGAQLTNETQKLSPLQLAASAAALSADGVRPGLMLVSAQRLPGGGWELFPSPEKPLVLLPADSARHQANNLSGAALPVWQTAAGERSTDGTQVAWFIAGTTQAWQGTPLVFVVLIENQEPGLAEKIGQQVLQSILLPEN
jgi:cell division protein FtsW (lipid II flippase)